MSLNDKFVATDRIDEDLLQALFSGRVILAHIPGFYDPESAKKLANALYGFIDEAANGGIYESDVESFWTATKDPERRERYFQAALPLLRRLRQLSAPLPSPIDLLRLALDEAWSGGACLMTMRGRKTPFGLTRLWRTESEALPHQDVLWREVDGDDGVVRFTSQLGANVYLDTAEEGGELESWDYVITDDVYRGIEQEYPGSYGYLRDLLPEESLVFNPTAGDLVLINTLHVHAVRKVKQGRRMTISGFVGACGPDQPLRCWS
jgi:hypothetical protein